MIYYALDFVNSEECDLVFEDQLYATEEEAAAARATMSCPECFDITPYRIIDLQDVYCGPVYVDENLRVTC